MDIVFINPCIVAVSTAFSINPVLGVMILLLVLVALGIGAFLLYLGHELFTEGMRLVAKLLMLGFLLWFVLRSKEKDRKS